ncbi:MAG: formate dehydrogenase accessory sulfurtransferase FdhD [bacterium]
MCGQSRQAGAPEPPTQEGAGLTARVAVTRVRADRRAKETDEVAREFPLLVSVDGREVCRLQCSPARLEELALGFLHTAGLVPPGAGPPVMSCDVSDSEARVDVRLGTSDEDVERLRRSVAMGTGCGGGLFHVKGLDPLDCERRVNMLFETAAAELSAAMRAFQARSVVYRETGGVHSAGVAAAGELIAFAEDVGRHNAVDKVVGHCLLNGESLDHKVLLSSGRLSLDVVAKAIRADVPVLASRSAPTEAAVRLARAAHLTLVGFLRGDRMNIYSAEWRVQ